MRHTKIKQFVLLLGLLSQAVWCNAVGTSMYNYRRQGLYHKHGFDLKGRIGAEGIKAGIYEPSVLPNGQYSISTFSPKWWHFIYYIPRIY